MFKFYFIFIFNCIFIFYYQKIKMCSTYKPETISFCCETSWILCERSMKSIKQLNINQKTRKPAAITWSSECGLCIRSTAYSCHKPLLWHANDILVSLSTRSTYNITVIYIIIYNHQEYIYDYNNIIKIQKGWSNGTWII